jgi:suppressor of ftsI
VPQIKVAKDYPLVMQTSACFRAKTTRPSGPACQSRTRSGRPSRATSPSDPNTEKAVPINLQGGFTTGDYKLRYCLTNGEPFFKEVHDPKNPTSPTPTQLKPPRFTLAPGDASACSTPAPTTRN